MPEFWRTIFDFHVVTTGPAPSERMIDEDFFVVWANLRAHTEYKVRTSQRQRKVGPGNGEA